MKNGQFEIVTLSDRQFGKLGDPVTVITAGISLLTSLFPNIFGGNRKRLTDADYVSLLPGSGYWTTRLRDYLKSRIQYDVDWVTNVEPFSAQFAYYRRDENQGFCDECSNPEAVKALYNLIREESNTGGNSPVGQVPGGYGSTLDYSTLIPIVIGGLALVLIMKKKKTTRRKKR